MTSAIAGAGLRSRLQQLDADEAIQVTGLAQATSAAQLMRPLPSR
jgi:hypothetical protein